MRFKQFLAEFDGRIIDGNDLKVDDTFTKAAGAVAGAVKGGTAAVEKAAKDLYKKQSDKGFTKLASDIIGGCFSNPSYKVPPSIYGAITTREQGEKVMTELKRGITFLQSERAKVYSAVKTKLKVSSEKALGDAWLGDLKASAGTGDRGARVNAIIAANYRRFGELATQQFIDALLVDEGLSDKVISYITNVKPKAKDAGQAAQPAVQDVVQERSLGSLRYIDEVLSKLRSIATSLQQTVQKLPPTVA